MTVFWRLAAVRDKAAAFGGSRFPNRWCWRGRPVYGASSIALAALERVVYIHAPAGPETLPLQYLFRVEIPSRVPIEAVDEKSLPDRWVDMRPLRSAPTRPNPLQAVGDRWITEQRSVALLVPSAHVPEEPNLLLNPEHPDYQKIAIRFWRPFAFDTRLSARLTATSST